MTEDVEQPGAAPPASPAVLPTGRTAEEIRRDPLVAAAIRDHADSIVDAREFAGEVTLIVARERIRVVCESFKADGFRYLVDLSGVDYSKYPTPTSARFGISYHLYSHAKNQRVRLKVFVGEGESVPSVSPVWKTANWHERETYDMFGIEFEGHPNLERILMWEGFNGFPLRKDFPLRGIDTGAAIYPEVFPEGGGPQPGSTGKNYKDVNLFKGDWPMFGRAPVGRTEEEIKSAREELQQVAGATGVPTASTMPKPTEDAPFHDPEMPLPKRMELAQNGDLKTKLFAAMAQTDCTACGWDCEGYAAALASGETKDITLCVPGEAETESMLQKLMAGAGKLG